MSEQPFQVASRQGEPSQGSLDASHRPSDLCLLGEVLHRLQISKSTYYKLLRQRRWPIRIFRFPFDDRPRFLRADVDAFIRSQGVVSSHPSRLRGVK